MKDNNLPLPAVRCLSKEEASTYLGIGVTLLTELAIPAVKFGRRLVYDVVDLDLWLEEYKQRERGRVGKDLICINPKMASIGGKTHATGGSIQFYRTADAYAQALGLKTSPKPKRI
jgi:hypothetical protein